MWYLIEQYFWFLLAAFIIGLFVGWATSEVRKIKAS